MTTYAQRKEVQNRSGGMCEGMVMAGRVWTRCWARPVEIHHILTRARGGDLLDVVGETYHLIALCKEHHIDSDGGDAYYGNLLIDGYVTWDKLRRWPIYKGSDSYLTERYSLYEQVHP